MIDESKVKKIIAERKNRLNTDKFKRYLSEANRLFGTNFSEEEFI